MKQIFLLVAMVAAIATGAAGQTGTGPGCLPDVTLTTADVGVRRFLYSPPRQDMVSFSGTYNTTGTPASVSVKVEASNHSPVTGTEPITKWGPFTNTSGTQSTDAITAKGAFKFWWVTLTTLSGGTAPTVVLSPCFPSLDPASASAVTVSGTVNTAPQSGTPDATSSGTITVVCASINSCAANSTVQVATAGYAGASFIVTLNSGSGTFNFDRSMDGGSTWKNDFATCWTASGSKSSITASDSCISPVPAGTSHVRVRSSACTACNVTVATRTTAAGPGVPIIFGTTGEAAFVGTPIAPSNGLITYPGAILSTSTTLADGTGSTAAAIVNSTSPGAIGNFLFNNTSWDRQRGTTPSATVGITCSACTSTQTGADQTNYNNRGVTCTYDVTTVTAVGTFHMDIQGKDELSGKYYTILTGANVSTAITTVQSVAPGIAVTANVTANTVLPRIWRVLLTYVSGTNQTATVGCSLIQ